MILYRLEMLKEKLEDIKDELQNYLQAQEINPSELNDMCIKFYQKNILCLENKIKELMERSI